MKKWTVFFLLVLICACSSHHIAVLQIPQINFGNYNQLEIPDFVVKPPAIAPTMVRKALADQIAAKLRRQQLFTAVLRHLSSQKRRVLLLEGIITEFYPGSRLKRGLSLGHMGTGIITARINFVDKETNQKITQLDVQAQINWGLSGGSLQKCYQLIADEVVKFVKFYY